MRQLGKRTQLGKGAAAIAGFVVALSLAAPLALAAPAPAPPDGPPAAVVEKALETTRKALSACLLADEKAAFEAYLALIHPERKPTREAVDDIRRYSWKRFRQQCRHFIKGDDPATLVVVRTQPDAIPDDAVTFKVFFQPVSQPERMPAPVIFRKLDADWLIDTNSM